MVVVVLVADATFAFATLLEKEVGAAAVVAAASVPLRSRFESIPTGATVALALTLAAAVVVAVAVAAAAAAAVAVATPLELSNDEDPSNLDRELVLPSLMGTATAAVFTLRLVSDPELAALIPKPILAKRLLSEPVFFRRSGGAGGTVVNPAAFLCNCCSRAYCSCSAFCLRNNS